MRKSSSSSMSKSENSTKSIPPPNLPGHIHNIFLSLEPLLNNTVKFHAEIFPLFDREVNPLQFALCLVSYTKIFRKGKCGRLPTSILEALKEYCTTRDLSHLLTRQQKLEAFDVALLFQTLNIYKPIFKIFELQDEREYILEMTRRLLAQKKFKEAYQTILCLDLENEFEAEDIVFPLFFHCHETWVKAYLTKCPRMQVPFVITLDSLCKGANAIPLFLRSIGLEGLKPSTGVFDKKWIMKRLPVYADLFNVDISSCPNLYRTRVGGAMNYLVRKMFIEESITYEGFEEMVIDTVGNIREVQLSLLSKLSSLGENAVAIRLAELLGIDKQDWPVSLTYSYPRPSPLLCDPQPYDFDYLPLRINRSDITFIDKEDQFISAVTDISENYDVVGVDAEWKPNLGLFKEKAALLQLATWDTIYLIDVIALNSNDMFSTWDYMMKKIFCNPEIIKLGYGISHDLQVVIKSLDYEQKWANYKYPRMVDLGLFFNKLKTHFPKINVEIDNMHSLTNVPKLDFKGLSQVCGTVLGKALNKNEQFTNWERRPLRETQITYAALDSYCLLMIYEKLYPLLKEHNLSLEKVLDSNKPPATSEKPKKAVPKAPIPISEFKVVVDHSVGGIVKLLRLLGADVIYLEEEGNHMDAVQIAQSQNRYIITTKAHYKKVIGYIPKEMCYCMAPELMPKLQVVSMMKHFGVECKDADLFSRCTICNGNDYIKVESKELLFHQSKTAGSDTKNKVKIGRKMNTVFTCDVTDMDGKLHRDFTVKLAECSADVPFFYICCSCGKAYWEGSHRSRCTKDMSEIFDIQCAIKSDLQ